MSAVPQKTQLAGLNRSVTAPSTVGAMVGVALAVLYASFTVNIVEGTRWQFAGIIAFWVTVANLLGDREEQIRLKVLKAIGLGTSPMNTSNLQAALREAWRIPEVSFWCNVGFWIAGSICIAVSYSLVPGVSPRDSQRIAYIGIAVGPLLSMMVLLMVQRRARIVGAKVAAAGLTAQQVVDALPRNRFQLRLRLVMFTLVAVTTPLFMVGDLALLKAGATVEQLLASTDAIDDQAIVAASGVEGVLALSIVASMVLFIVILCGYLGGSSLGVPLAAIALETQRVARGKLGQPTPVVVEDEIWGAASALTSMELQLVQAIAKLRVAGSKIGGTTEELISSSLKHEAGAAEQTGALAQTSATTEELARSARQIADNASEVSRLAQAMLESAQGGKRSAGAFYSSILRVRDGNQAIADSVVKLNKRVQQVGRIVEFIDGIADKSDLLALNAELEGTKAGEVGRGFSLVAAEMRRLSESVMSSTREINRLIDEIRDATNAAVMATEAGVKATDAGSGLARQVTESLDRIVEFANHTSDAVKSITLATHQQQGGTDQLALAMTSILTSTQSSAGATQQMSSANADLSVLSRELQEAVQRFEVDP